VPVLVWDHRSIWWPCCNKKLLVGDVIVVCQFRSSQIVFVRCST
jgi:hypothetical protein